jgi:hypothetical protein
MKKLTRERVVPIISAKVSWLTFARIGWGLLSLPKFAKRSKARARRFSLELKVYRSNRPQLGWYAPGYAI